MSLNARLNALESKLAPPARTSEIQSMSDEQLNQLQAETIAGDGPLLRASLVAHGGLRLRNRKLADVPPAELDAAFERATRALEAEHKQAADARREREETFQRLYGQSLASWELQMTTRPEKSKDASTT